MGEVPAGSEREPEKGVARLQGGEKRRLIGLRARMGLHVGEAAAEQRNRALDREPLGDIDILAAAVVAPAGVALGVFVGEHRALGLQHSAAHDVLGRDQLDGRLQALNLAGYRRVHRRIGIPQRAGEERSPGPALGARGDGHERVPSSTGPGQESLATRALWRPPSKSVSRNARRQRRAVSSETRRAPRASTLASL